MKLVTIIGARPQFIKAATVSRVVSGCDDINEVIVHTGQHYDNNMSQVFFDELQIPEPDYNLNIGSSFHGQQTGQMLAAIEEVLFKEKPDVVLVYGDTNSTIAGALAAVKLHLPVAHVEAGLRSFNNAMPEEINRIVTDRISDFLFVPTATAVKNLKQEGVADSKIFNVGDVMYDAALFYSSKVQQNQQSILDKLGLQPREYILVTIHRAENTDDLSRLENIIHALNQIGIEHKVVLPLHPRTKQVLVKHDMLDCLANINVIDPVSYLDMVALEMHAKLIATDSGGVQKEAFFYEVPCVTLRDETEWVELVDSGWNHLVSPVNVEVIRDAISSRLNKKGNSGKLYGSGDAASEIVRILEHIR